MDEAAANRILEDYLAGRASEAEFGQALDFLKDRARFVEGLAALYRDLDLPGGISHEAAQDLMPYYLEPLARAGLPLEERRRFVAHLVQCPACATDFLELAGLTTAPVFSRPVTKAVPAQVQAGPKPWPTLQPLVQTIKTVGRKVLYGLSFSPVSASGVRETGAFYQTGFDKDAASGEYAVLFEDFLDEDAGTGLQASITAWRTSPVECDLQVELVDPLEQIHQAGQTVTLSYGGKKISQLTGETGETVFPGLEIARLTSIKIEIEVKS